MSVDFSAKALNSSLADSDLNRSFGCNGVEIVFFIFGSSVEEVCPFFVVLNHGVESSSFIWYVVYCLPVFKLISEGYLFMKYVVTGCAGFIGSHLSARLIELGHYVIGMDSL